MVLDGEDRQGSHGKPGKCPVIEIDVRGLSTHQFEGLLVYGKAVVLAGDFDAPGKKIEDGLIETSVSELEFVGLSTEGEGEELMAEADAEGGNGVWAFEEAGERGDGAGDGGGVAGAVGDEQPVGLVVGEAVGDLVSTEVVRDDVDVAPAIGEVAEDVAFCAAVEGEDAETGTHRRGACATGGPLAEGFAPSCGIGAADVWDEVEAVHVWGGQSGVDECVVGELVEGQVGDDGAHDAACAEAASEGAGVDAGDTKDIVIGEV